MKKLFVAVCLVSLCQLAATSPFTQKQLIGVWKIQTMEVKGMKMRHQEMGEPFIEFNEEGGFMIKLSSSSSKGRYKLKGNTVTLKFLYPKKPSQELHLSKLDDTEMDYTTVDSSGTVKVTCFRITTGFDDDKDKDKDKDKDRK